MRRYMPLFVLLGWLTTIPAMAATWQERPDWNVLFAHAGLHGTMLVYDEADNRWLVHDAARARQPYIPASTFKLFNSMVALDSGDIQDEYEVLRWDGMDRGRPAWNRDQNMVSAFRVSALWFYQAMARRTGQTRMQQWIDRVGYGNRDIRGGIDHFWLDGRLRISAEQQIQFLRALADGSLPFSARAQETVRRISIVEAQPHYILHAKTGVAPVAASTGTATTYLGWYVGWVESRGRRWFFAINVDQSNVVADTDKRLTLARKVLEDVDALPPTAVQHP